MITKEFIELTDKIIKGLHFTGSIVGNGNLLIAKPPVEDKTKGGLFVPEMAKELEQKKRGFGRVLAIPNNLRPEDGDLPLEPGDYVFYTWTAENPVNREMLGNIIDVKIPPEMLAHTLDAEVILMLKAETVHSNKLI